MEIYNNNIMPSIYTNPDVWYMSYLPVGNSSDPSCGNYFGRVEQEKFPLNSSAVFSQPVAMRQVMPMNNLYGRSNLDGLANYFGYSCQKARSEVTPISYQVPCTVASGFHSAQYATNHYSQMNDCASTSQKCVLLRVHCQKAILVSRAHHICWLPYHTIMVYRICIGMKVWRGN
jgi:hypothetical protein